MAAVLGSFVGNVFDLTVELRVYSTHLELEVGSADNALKLVVEMVEVAEVDVRELQDVPTLSIRDVSGVLIASLSMDAPSAAAAKALIERVMPR